LSLLLLGENMGKGPGGKPSKKFKKKSGKKRDNEPPKKSS
jgi:hypothetical protein